MDKYLKMADVFKHLIEPRDSSNGGTLIMHANRAWYAAHAINSHDELVADVERLRDVIFKIKNPSNDDCLDFLCAALRHCDYEIKGDFEIGDMKPAFILYANKKGA